MMAGAASGANPLSGTPRARRSRRTVSVEEAAPPVEGGREIITGPPDDRTVYETERQDEPDTDYSDDSGDDE